MDKLHTANKVYEGCCAISLNTVDTESSVSPNLSNFVNYVVTTLTNTTFFFHMLQAQKIENAKM